MKYKKLTIIPVFLLTLSLAACTQGRDAGNDTAGTSETAAETTRMIATAVQTEGEMFTGRDFEVGYSDYVTVTLSDGGSMADGDGVTIEGNTVTIDAEGSYLLSGLLSDGQIIVDADDADKIQLILAGADVTSSSSAAIYVKQADKVFITLADESENSLRSGGEYVQTDDNNVDAAVFSKADLTLNGSGSVEISSAYGHGVVSKDDLAVTGGSYTIIAASHGLSGKDSVRIASGSFAIDAGKDCIHAENADDAEKGYVFISGGSFIITAAGDGIDASGTLQIDDGDFAITSGGGSADIDMTGGAQMGGDFRNDWGQQSMQTESSDDTASAKGLKADGGLMISGGCFKIDSYDDALHSNAGIAVAGGEFQISCGDDGVHADTSLTIIGGSLSVSQCYEGLEAQVINISGGTISLIASDDGLNASNGGGGFGGGTSGLSISISGGTLKVNADGDGIDSNGSITISGGETYISGPTNSGNGALDYQGSGSITGGVVVAAGSTGMAMNFDSDSTQGSILYSLSEAAGAGTEITLSDSGGNLLAQYTPDKQFQSVLVSASGIQSGATYTLTVGSNSYRIEMSSLLYGSGSGFGGGNRDGGMPSGGGTRGGGGMVPGGGGGPGGG